MQLKKNKTQSKRRKSSNSKSAIDLEALARRAQERLAPIHSAILKKARQFVHDDFIEAARAMRRRLEDAYNSAPQIMGDFFKKYPMIASRDVADAQRHILGITDESVRRVLNEYVSYALRYAVSFQLSCTKSSRRRFFSQFESSTCPEFSAQIINGRVVPYGYKPDEGCELVAACENWKVKLRTGIPNLPKGPRINFFNLEERGGSVLTDIETIAYDPGTITFIEHIVGIDGSKPHKFLFLLMGAATSHDQQRRALSQVSSFFTINSGRSRRGRKPDLDKRKLLIEAATPGKFDSAARDKLLERHYGDNMRSYLSATEYASRHAASQRKRGVGQSIPPKAPGKGKPGRS